MQAHLDGRNISGLREAEDFIAPRTTNHRITNAEDLPMRSWPSETLPFPMPSAPDNHDAHDYAERIRESS